MGDFLQIKRIQKQKQEAQYGPLSHRSPDYNDAFCYQYFCHKLVFLANQLILWESSKEKVQKATMMIFIHNVIMT